MGAQKTSNEPDSKSDGVDIPGGYAELQKIPLRAFGRN
jgi:hypothetical protein